MGEWDAFRENEIFPVQEYVVARIVIHPSFNPANLKSDIAVLRLASPVSLGQFPTIATACLPNTTYFGQRCFISGWGKNNFVIGNYQVVQKEVDVPILPPTTCQASLSATRLGSSFVFDSSSFICAGGEFGKDACSGDGGSPLVCRAGNQFYVAGLVAWGIGCGATNIPGVYVNVLNFLDWINSIIN